MRRILSSFIRSQNGNIAMLFGLAMFVILATAGMALDYQRATAIKTDLQEASDAALLAAVKYKSSHPNVTDADIKSRTKSLFQANLRNASSVVYSNFDLSFDPKTDQYTLKFNTRIKTSFLHAVKFAGLTPPIISKAKLGKPPYLEVVMVLDNTGSMSSKGKLGDLKTSAKNLVKSLYLNPDADVKIGLVPFAQYANVGAGASGQSWLDVPNTDNNGNSFKGCIGSRGYPANTTDRDYNVNPVPGVTGAACPEQILALTDNTTAIENAIDAMKASGWTYIPAGLAWGWRVISADAPYTEGVTSTVLKDKNGYKAIILMTDGENTRSPDYPTHNDSSVTDANKITQELCNAVKAEDIIVYTIAFAVSDTTIKTLLEDCGSTPSHYFDAKNSAELNDAFEAIAGTLRTISLTQ